MRRRASKVIALVALGFAIIGTTEACRTATQVELVVTYDGKCSDLEEVAFIIGTDPTVAEARIESNVFTTTTTHCEQGSPSRVGSLVVTPNDATGHASIIVLGAFGQHASDCKPEKGYAGCIVARRAFAFVDHTALTLQIPLEASCKNVPCDAQSTCKNMACVNSNVSCAEGGCGEPGVIADGGIEFADAPTNPDAYVQGLDGAMPPLDGAITDSSGVDAAEAASEGGSCTITPDQPVTCTVPGGVVKTCAMGATCCFAVKPPPPVEAGAGDGGPADAAPGDAGGTSGYDCHTPGECTNQTAEPALSCRSSANCPANNVCCVEVLVGSVSCMLGTSCGAFGTMTKQACTESCECSAGHHCGPGPTFGTLPPQAPIGICLPD